MSAWHEHLYLCHWLRDWNRGCSLWSPSLPLLNLIPTLSAVSHYCHVQQRQEKEDSSQHLLLASAGEKISNHSLPLCFSDLTWRETREGFPHGASLAPRNLLKDRFSINTPATVYWGKEWQRKRERRVRAGRKDEHLSWKEEVALRIRSNSCFLRWNLGVQMKTLKRW